MPFKINIAKRFPLASAVHDLIHVALSMTVLVPHQNMQQLCTILYLQLKSLQAE